MSRICILVVEDEPIIRMALVDALRSAGHRVLEAADATDAEQALRDDCCDVLVTDIQLPGPLSGIEVAARARGLDPRLPVVFVSGWPEALGGLGALGPRDAFIRKPYTPQEVLSAIRRVTV